MKQSHWIPGVRLAALLLILTIVLTGCGKKSGGGGSATTQNMAVTLPKKYNIPPGADPSVSAEMGGNGFEKIAADSGWQTAAYTPEQFRYIADTAAKKGGRLTLAYTDFPATFRFFGKDANSDATEFIVGSVYQTIININPVTLDFMPGLATHWKVGPDKQTYYFRLNPNARFSDGHAVTTEDVLATYKLGSDSTILDPYENAQNADYDPPVAISEYIFSVHSKTLNWKNMLYFGLKKIYPAHVIGNLTGAQFLKQFQYDMPPGSGPYTVLPSDVQKGKEFSLTRLSDWWQKDDPQMRGQYNFDKLRVTVVEDERLRLEKFKKEESDVYIVARAQWWMQEMNFDEIQRGLIQKHRIYNDKPQGVSGIAFNMRKPPFNDPKVRLAFVYLFNREQLIEKLMFNQYTLMDSYYPNSDYANPNNPKFRYDPAKGAQLLAEAGYTSRNSNGILVKNGQPLSIDMPITPDFERIITPVQQEMKKAGIEINLRNTDAVTEFKMAMERNFMMLQMPWTGVPWPNPYSQYSSELADKPNTNNVTGFKNARVDELINLEKSTFDQGQRVVIMREIDSILMQSNQYALMWYAPYTRLLYWNYLGHPDFYLSRTGDWKDMAQYWWSIPENRETVEKGRSDKSVKMDPGTVDIQFWPEYDKSHTGSQAASATDSASKPMAHQ